MKLREWMRQKGYKPPGLAIGINAKLGTKFSKTSIYRILDGHNPSLELAVAIDMFTDKEVTPLDLLEGSSLTGIAPKKDLLDDLLDGL